MKAYIKSFEESHGYRAEVVTADDYHNRGPFARSFLSPWRLTQEDAEKDAKAYALKSSLELVSVDEI